MGKLAGLKRYNFASKLFTVCTIICQDRRFYFNGKPHALYNCAIKENFMHALGLQQRQKTAEMCSVAEFLANNVEATSIDSSFFDASKSSTNELVSDKSYQSWSEESSDCSDRRTSCDSATKKTRRSNLPREELERLREKERLAKRRQRAKNKRVRKCVACSSNCIYSSLKPSHLKK